MVDANEAEQALKKTRGPGMLLVYLRVLGPGLVTGASDDGPSGIGTYARTGAQFGYARLWVALFTVPLMIAIQEARARIGLQAGTGLAEVMRRHYPG